MEEYRESAEVRHVGHVRRIGLFGGTFDPIHYAHLAIAEEVRVTLALEEMVFIPAGQPPHKPGQKVTEARHRLAMLKLALASNKHFSYSQIELERPGPSYLVDTLRSLREQWGTGTALNFVIGWDSLEELHTWYDPEGILAQLDLLIAVARPGYAEQTEAFTARLEQRLPGITQRLRVVTAPQLEISSSDLRQRVGEGRSIKYLLPEAVEQYIAEHRLYRQ